MMLRNNFKKLVSKFFSSSKNKYSLLNTLETGGYNFYYKKKEIFTHDPQCVYGPYKQIFVDEIYHFITEKENPLILDVGANIGLAIMYWKNLYPHAKVIAFEPSKEVFRSLKRNIESNNLSDVELHQKAVSDKEGIANFTSNEKISGSLVLEKNLENNYEVEVVKLSKFLKDKEIDFLKIDIEGEEKKVFFEILPYLDNVKNIFIEYHSFIHEKQYLSQILQHLEMLDFRYYIEDDFKVEKPLTSNYTSLNQDMKLNIWAKKYK